MERLVDTLHHFVGKERLLIYSLVGYIGRIIMHNNPWSGAGFKTQICCLVLAPSFLAAGIYVTLKHLVIYCGPENSRLKPRLYPWVFIGCDFGSIVLQAIGGGVASAAGDHGSKPGLLKSGNGLIVAGVSRPSLRKTVPFIRGLCLLACQQWYRLTETHRVLQNKPPMPYESCWRLWPSPEEAPGIIIARKAVYAT